MTGVLAATLVPRDGMNSTSFTDSMLRMVMFDANQAGHLIAGGGPLFLPASPNTIADMRNRACALLLDETESDWLLFIDSDMGFHESALYELLAVADPAERPVVGALCFGMRQAESDGIGGWVTHPFPVLFDWTENEAGKWGFSIRYGYTIDTVTRVAATGAAFLLIHRSVLSQLRDQHGDTWFSRAVMEPGEGAMGEDVAFCARLGRAGIPVYVHTGVKTTHIKPVWIDEGYYLAQRSLAMAERGA